MKTIIAKVNLLNVNYNTTFVNVFKKKKIRTPKPSMFKRIIYTLAIVSISHFLSAQESSLYRNYMFNNFYNLNSAAAGYDGNFISQITISKKWLGIKDSPSSQVLSNSIRLGKWDYFDKNNYYYSPGKSFINKIGVGFTFFNETNGPIRHTGVLMAYAYHIPLRTGQLSFGLSGIVAQYGLNTDKFKPIEVNDPTLYYTTSAVVPDANFGMLFYNRNLFAGVSINGLINLNRVMDHTNMTPAITACAGYRIGITSEVKVEPSVFAIRDGQKRFSTDINAKLYYTNRYWVLLSYQSSGGFQGGFAMNIKTGLQLSYAVAVSTSGLANRLQNSQNISLRADIAALTQRSSRKR